MTEHDVLLLSQVREDARSGRARQTRTSAGITQAELAAATGVSQTTIALWEAGRRRPRGTAALRYARVLRRLASDR
jgi:DNA-binding XRE family transcriptional regulator